MKRFRLPTPQAAMRQIAMQVAGVVVLGATQRYIPNVWARWAVYGAAACVGIWYPITRATLTVTKLDSVIETI